MTFCFLYGDNQFMEIWQPVSKVKQFSKKFELLVRNKSIQDGLLTFLKQLASLFRDFSLYWLQNAFIFASLGSTLKSLIISGHFLRSATFCTDTFYSVSFSVDD